MASRLFVSNEFFLLGAFALVHVGEILSAGNTSWCSCR